MTIDTTTTRLQRVYLHKNIYQHASLNFCKFFLKPRKDTHLDLVPHFFRFFFHHFKSHVAVSKCSIEHMCSEICVVLSNYIVQCLSSHRGKTLLDTVTCLMTSSHQVCKNIYFMASVFLFYVATSWTPKLTKLFNIDRKSVV